MALTVVQFFSSSIKLDIYGGVEFFIQIHSVSMTW